VVCLGLAVLGCGSGGPKGRAVKWRHGDQVYTATPDRLPGRWTDGRRTVAFDGTGGVSWDGAAGRYRFLDDGSLLVQVEGPALDGSFKYTVVEDKLILLSNERGTWNEFRRADPEPGR
jgi:hypothetical protein